MSLGELLASVYGWAQAHSVQILLAAFVVPVLGTIAAWIGRGGRTDRDGRAIASALVGIGLGVFALALVAALLAHLFFGRSMLEAHVALLAAPVVCLGLCLAGVRLVFPLDELASVRTLRDVGLFVLACAIVLWLFSKFRGWGIVFWGDLGQLALILVFGFVLLRRLYRRAFSRRR